MQLLQFPGFNESPSWKLEGINLCSLRNAVIWWANSPGEKLREFSERTKYPDFEIEDVPHRGSKLNKYYLVSERELYNQFTIVIDFS